MSNRAASGERWGYSDEFVSGSKGFRFKTGDELTSCIGTSKKRKKTKTEVSNYIQEGMKGGKEKGL